MLITAAVLAATLTSGAETVLARYEADESKKLVPMLVEVIRFPTYEQNPKAHADQKAWLMKTAKSFGFESRDAGKITEIELPGPEGAPVLGLVIHGDVQRAEASAWSFPPFEGKVADGYVFGRGAADDKGPLIQALLAMKALRDSELPRTHTIRLLVGSEEESAAGEIAEYLKDHQAPDYSLVLDSEFPVVVGEKAWDGVGIEADISNVTGGVRKRWVVESVDAGLSPSIVPDRAEIVLRWSAERLHVYWDKLVKNLAQARMPEGTRLETKVEGDRLRVTVYGKSAHAGVNIAGGRNALVALARALEGELPAGGADDLFAFARMAGQDVYGTGLGLTTEDPLWGRYAVNVATLKQSKDDPSKAILYINLRRTPPRTGPEAKAYYEKLLQDFNLRHTGGLRIVPEVSWFSDEPLVFDPNAKIVRTLMDIYARATGEKPKPAISGGGTYAKRLPNSIAFGMWFPGKPYPGHDVDEKIPIADLERGARVLVHAITELATGPKIEKPFEP